jgi:hypothetical protein
MPYNLLCWTHIDMKVHYGVACKVITTWRSLEIGSDGTKLRRVGCICVQEVHSVCRVASVPLLQCQP